MENNSTMGLVLVHGMGQKVRPSGGLLRARLVFVWPEDIEVDVLGQHLAGTAQKYYRRQVESWWSESQTLEHAIQMLFRHLPPRLHLPKVSPCSPRLSLLNVDGRNISSTLRL